MGGPKWSTQNPLEGHRSCEGPNDPPLKVFFGSDKIETICVHDLGPCGDEVVHELLLVVILSIDFGIGAKD